MRNILIYLNICIGVVALVGPMDAMANPPQGLTFVQKDTRGRNVFKAPDGRFVRESQGQFVYLDNSGLETGESYTVPRDQLNGTPAAPKIARPDSAPIIQDVGVPTTPIPTPTTGLIDQPLQVNPNAPTLEPPPEAFPAEKFLRRGDGKAVVDQKFEESIAQHRDAFSARDGARDRRNLLLRERNQAEEQFKRDATARSTASAAFDEIKDQRSSPELERRTAELATANGNLERSQEALRQAEDAFRGADADYEQAKVDEQVARKKRQYEGARAASDLTGKGLDEFLPADFDDTSRTAGATIDRQTGETVNGSQTLGDRNETTFAELRGGGSGGTAPPRGASGAAAPSGPSDRELLDRGEIGFDEFERRRGSAAGRSPASTADGGSDGRGGGTPRREVRAKKNYDYEFQRQGGPCGTAEALGHGQNCDVAKGYAKIAPMISQGAVAAGATATGIAAQNAQNRAISANSQAETLKQASKTARTAGIQSTSVGATLTTGGLMGLLIASQLDEDTVLTESEDENSVKSTNGQDLEGQNDTAQNWLASSGDQAKYQASCDRLPKGQGFEECVANMERKNKGELKRLGRIAHKEINAVETEAQVASFAMMLQGAQQTMNGVAQLKQARDLKKSARRLQDAQNGTPFEFKSDPLAFNNGQNANAPTRGATQIRPGNPSNRAGALADADDIDNEDDGDLDLGDPTNLDDRSLDDLGRGDEAGDLAIGDGQGGGGGGPAPIGGGSTNPAQAAATDAPQSEYAGLDQDSGAFQSGAAQGAGGAFQRGGAARAGGGGGGLADLLKNFLPGGQDEQKENRPKSILDLSEKKRAPARAEGILAKNSTILFNRIGAAMNRKVKSGDLAAE